MALLETAGSGAIASESRAIQLVVSEDSLFARETANRLQNLFQQSVPGIELERMNAATMPTASSATGRHLVVTVGDIAWQTAAAASPRDSSILALFPQHSSFDSLDKRSPRNASAIFLQQPVGRMLNLVSLLKPRDAQVGVVLGATTQTIVPLLQVAADERNQRLRLETASEEAAVGRALSKMINAVNILLAIPDPVVQTANTVQSILLMSYRAGIPVIGYSAAYQRAGAMVSLYTTPDQLARQAVDAVIAWRQGKGLPATQEPKYFTVGINNTVAHSLGIELPDADALEQKLRSMKE